MGFFSELFGHNSQPNNHSSKNTSIAVRSTGLQPRHMRVNRLMELDAQVIQEKRITMKNPIEKMKKEYKNK